MCWACSELLAISGVARNVRIHSGPSIPLLMMIASFYQEHVAKNMTEKYGHANGQIDNIINEAKLELGNLQCKLASLQPT